MGCSTADDPDVCLKDVLRFARFSSFRSRFHQTVALESRPTLALHADAWLPVVPQRFRNGLPI